MRPVTVQFLLLITIILTASCSEQSLTGRWKLREVDLVDMPNEKKQIILDLTKPDKMKADLYEANLPIEQDLNTDTINALNDDIDGIDTTIDVSTIKAVIDEYVASLLHTNMTLTANNKFYMRSNGLIVPTAVPGWHFGDTVQGEWTRNKDTLLLSIGDDKHSYKWKFKILQVTNKDLKLQEVFDVFEGSGNVLWFVRR